MKKKRPEVLDGKTEKIATGCGTLYLIINKDEETKTPCEFFPVLGKSGSCARSLLELIGKLLSVVAQNLSKEDFIKLLKKDIRGVNCGQEFRIRDKRYGSCIDKMAHRLLQEFGEEE